MLRVERRDTIAVLRLEHGAVNALDLELCEAIVETLGELADEAVGAVVVTGDGQTFSAGVDLVRILDEQEGGWYRSAFLAALGQCFDAMLRWPGPTVAAVDGAAIAGGCVLASACDRRFLGARARIGLTELAVGVPFPTTAIEIMRHRAGARLGEAVFGAATYGADAAVSLGLAEEVVADADLLERAADVASAMAAVPRDTYALAKQQVLEPVLDRIDRLSARWEPDMVDVWGREEVQAQVTAFAREHLGYRG